MASTSGSTSGNFVTISSPYGCYIFVNWQLAGQNIAGNYSTINWQAYVHFVSSDAQLDNGAVTCSIGTLWANGGRVHNYGSNNTTRDLALSSGSFTIGHDSNGNCTFGISESIAVFSSGTSSGGGSWTLPQIPRYANFTTYNVTSITDVGFTIQIAADNYCSNIEYSLDGGSTWTSLGAGSSANAYPTNLKSETTYNVYARITRADSGLQTTSGLLQPTTLSQDGFIGLL